MAFPVHRMRRLRGNSWAREMVRETRLHVSTFVEPFFVGEGQGRRDPVGSMPEVFQLSADTLIEVSALASAANPATAASGRR